MPPPTNESYCVTRHGRRTGHELDTKQRHSRLTLGKARFSLHHLPPQGYGSLTVGMRSSGLSSLTGRSRYVMLRFVFVKQRAGMFHIDSCCVSNKTCRVDDRAQKSWLAITATTFAELATTRKKSCTRTNPANMVQQLTKAAHNAAWHRRARFQLQRKRLCAMCLAESKVVAARIAIISSRTTTTQSGSGTASCRACSPHCHESRKKFVENRGFDQTIDADGWPTDLRHSVYRYP